MSNGSSIRANVRMKFYTRFALLGLAALAFAGWFFKDGLVSYPHQAEVWTAYNELKGEPEADHAGDHGHGEEATAEHDDDFPQEEWEAIVAERGWEKSVVFVEGEARQPLGKFRTPWKINEQLVVGSICVPVGLGFLLKVLLARGMWIESDGQAITSSWGKGFRFEDVIEINKKKWRDKGLAYVKHESGGGAKTFVIDDLKFDRQPTDAILYQLEQAVGADKIVGGVPEIDPDAPPVDEAGTDEGVAPEEAAAAE